MKICYIGANDPFMRKFATTFRDKGNEIHLITWGLGDPLRESMVGDWDGIHVNHLGGTHPSFNKWCIPLAALNVRRLIRRINPDIIHSHYLFPNTIYGALSGFHPHVASAYGSDIYISPKTYPMISTLIKFSLKKTDTIMTTSHQLKNYMYEFGFVDKIEKIKDIPWGIDLDLFCKRDDENIMNLKVELDLEEKFVILNPRGLSRLIGSFTQSITALSKVVEYDSSAVLILLTGGLTAETYKKELFDIIKKLDLEDNVRYVDKLLNPTRMSEFYNVSDVLLSIPISDQFASCIQEGMASGLIPIVNRLEVYKKYLEDGKNAFFASRDDADEIAGKIIHCIENPDLKDKFYRINRKLIEKYADWEKNSEKIFELYNSLVSSF